MGDASRPLGGDDDLMELLWCNGHVVMQSQTHRKLPPRPEKAAAAAVMQEDEAGLWFRFSHADSLDKDIFSDLFCEAVPAVVVAAPPAGMGIKPDCCRDGNGKASDAPSELMPPPKSTHASTADGGELSDLVQARMGKAAAAAMEQEGASASSFCGSSNQVQVQQRAAGGSRVQSAGTAAYGSAGLQSAVGSGINANARGGGHEATVASSSGRSNGCFTATTTTTEPTSTSHRSSKRKRLDSTEDSESPSEDAESESLALIERKPPQKLATARRSRAAEVHNLSERRRRDRINEKMKALQELIPHCNKTDKASMLDEAIEYLKTLQMQVQMMWMGSGMAPPAVMFPGMHQYLPPRMPSFMAPQPAAAAAQSLPEHYAHFLGVNHHLQPPSHHHQHQAAQGMGYYPLGAKAVQQSPELPVHHVPTATGGTPAPAAAATATNNNTPGNGMHPNRR